MKAFFDNPRIFGNPLPGITQFGGGLRQTVLPFIPRLEIRSVLTFATDQLGNPYER